MRNTIERLSLLAAALAVNAVAVADTKLTMEERAIVGSDAAPRESVSQYTLWLREDRAARVSPDTRMIARVDLGEAYLIDEARQTVTTIDLGGVSGALATAPQIRNTGETRTIGDWDAERYELALETGGLQGTIVLWISSDVGVETDAYRAYLRSLDGGTGTLTAIAELPGYPVLQETDLGVVKSTARLLSATEETAPAGTYDVPVGYERK